MYVFFDSAQKFLPHFWLFLSISLTWLYVLTYLDLISKISLLYLSLSCVISWSFIYSSYWFALSSYWFVLSSYWIVLPSYWTLSSVRASLLLISSNSSTDWSGFAALVFSWGFFSVLGCSFFTSTTTSASSFTIFLYSLSYLLILLSFSSLFLFKTSWESV